MPRICIVGGRDCLGVALPGGSRCANHEKGGWTKYKIKHPERQAFYASPQWKSARERHLKTNPICVRCGQPATNADHIEAIALGGREDGPLQSMCATCHHKKTVADSHEAAKRAAARRKQGR